jgi:hypothetical protein
MEQKLFGLSLDVESCEIVLRDNQYFVHYDADPPRNAWREDELSEDDAYSFGSSKLGAYQVLAGLRQRLGEQAHLSNWTPPVEDEEESE